MTENTGQPKYLQVAAELRRAISGRIYPVGSELPSTAKLTEAYGVSTTVVRAAIRELRDEGLVIGQPGKAVYVKAEPGESPANATDLGNRVRTLELALEDVNARLTALEGNGRSK